MKLDFLILADFAEVANSKLYLQGGCWDVLGVGTGFPHQRNIGVAAGIDIPWEDTNHRYTLKVDVFNDDTQEVVIAVEGQLETGRPAGLPPGQAQLVTMALNGVLNLAGPGQFVVRAFIDGVEQRRRPFRVVNTATR
jgi:hypothetical protein